MDGAIFWALASLAAFCVGLSKGGAPAFGTLAVPILSLTVSPLLAAGLLLPVFVFSDPIGLWAYRRWIDRHVLVMVVPGILVGTALGWVTAHLVSETAVRLLVGGIGLVFSANFLRRTTQEGPVRPARWPGAIFWTGIAGFTSFVAHAGAPPWQVWALPQRMPKLAFAGTSTAAFTVMNLSKIVPYVQLGQLGWEQVQASAVLFLPALAGVGVAYRLVRILPDRVFYRVVTWMLFAVSVKLIWDGWAVL